MPEPQAVLSPAEARVIFEEEGLLERTGEALTRALKRASARSCPIGWSPAASLRELRSEAMNASEDDQPTLLHELYLRQSLARKPVSALPDLACPYLAHLGVREGETQRDYLLVSTSWLEDSVRIVDWRLAPIAQIFTSRTQDGTWARTSNALGALSSGGAGRAARALALGVGVGKLGRSAAPPVTALLDAAQYAAVTASAREPLLVLGNAGSGKTTVALHRLLHIRAHEKEDSRRGRPVEELNRGKLATHTAAARRSPKAQLSHISVAELKRGVDGRALADGTPRELGGSIDVEELPILIFLKVWLDGAAPELTHLVLDEAEDFSPFELFVLGKLLKAPGSVTLAGDEAQTTTSAFGGWPFVLETVGADDARVCRLSVSYRCPQPIVEFAERLLPARQRETSVRSERAGAPIGLFGFPTQEQAELYIAEATRDILDREPLASVAVIAASREAARSFYSLVAQRPGSRLVLDGEFGFRPGIDVTHVDAVKGLEFDYVIVPDATALSYPDTTTLVIASTLPQPAPLTSSGSLGGRRGAR